MPPLRILTVEDDHPVRELLALLFARSGHEVVTAESGARALELCHELAQAFDVILMDMALPGMHGLEVVRRLRRDPRTSEAIILGLSAFASPDDSEAALRSGCDDYLTKPFRASELLARVEALALHPRRRDA